ncbi:uncharacterized protein LOC131176608 [Hevea brasiliensis]|uniref:uncharacterized protein LOC131176608 n=1 Tax=Hevea brasiliensis TaxID=3981 RepID=UPI0025DFC0A2|nr:uncharacterized protein LOC131176608 [Hevea brasiliensis]
MVLQWNPETKDTILKVLGVAIASVLSLVSLLQGSSSAEDHQILTDLAYFHAEEVLSGHLPLNFYVLTFATNVLIVCTGAIIVLLWSIPCRPLVIYTLITVGILYALLMVKITPKFAVRVLGHEVSSYVLVWSLALTFIFSTFMAYHSLIYACLGLSKLGTWLFAKLKLYSAWFIN